MRLHISESGQMAPYATLSYCWGGDQLFKTTAENFLLMQESLDYNSLPKTIQDAILVTRQIGLRYLWIDALCIIQDSQTDIAYWINRMDSVYSDCTICIGAAVAKVVSEGFLRPPRQHPRAVKLPFDFNKGGKGHVWATRDRSSVDPEPLFQRAWAFQERYLSPRLLMYTQNGLMWECWEKCESVTNDCSSYYYKTMLSRTRNSRPLNSKGQAMLSRTRKSRPLNSKGQDALKVTLAEWHDAVTEYSGLLATFSSDKLPALAGIARKFHSMRTGTYLAGLWEENLWFQLSWYRCCGDETFFPPDDGTPSWSWSSVNARTIFPDPEHLGDFLRFDPSSRVKVHMCDTILESYEAPFGKVKGGTLEVEAFLFPVSQLPLSWRNTTVMDDNAKELEFGFGDERDDILCMVIGVRHPKAKQWGAGADEGIFLIPTNSNSDTFRRIGFFSSYNYIGYGKSPHTPKVLMDLPAQAVRRRITII